MYESHFGFSGPPFQLNPDPAFYFNSRGHGHALAYLRYGVAQGEGFIVVTGEIGAGKTTLLRALLDELDRAQVVAAQIVSTQLESGDLLQAIITAFGIPTQGVGKASLIATLEAFLMTLATQGRRALLIIDEAQNLEIRAIEELRMLSNFQLGTQSLLQSFLVGQPELRKKLESQEMEQLRQRVTASCHLGPLGLEETRGYVEHRLKRVGWANRPSFEDAAFDQIYSWSGGVPRRINRLCNRLLLATFLEGRDTIVSSMVEATAHELRQEIGEAAFEPLPLPARAESAVSATESIPAPAVPEPATVAVVEKSRVAEVPSEPRVVQQSVEPVEESASSSAKPVVRMQPSLAETSAASDGIQAVDTPVSARASAAEVSAVLSVPEVATKPSVVRTQAIVLKPRKGVMLCVVDSTAAGLKLSAVVKALDGLVEAPRLVLVNPGAPADAWPWEEMESVLPAPEVAVHLCVAEGALESRLPALCEALGPVIDEFAPLGVVTLGTSDAVLACHLLAHKRGLATVRLESGERRSFGSDGVNASLVEQMSDVLFAPNSREAHQQLYRSGVAFDKVFGVPGSLAVDVIAAALPSMTTPYGAFLRHRLPIFLGPRWSSEVDGTAYAVLTLQLTVADTERTRRVLDALINLPSAPKLLWLADSATREALRVWQQAAVSRAADVFIVEDTLPREEIDRRNSARILCSDIRSLADQFSIVRGAVAVITEPGHMLSEAATILDIPCVLAMDQRLNFLPGSETAAETHAWSVGALADILSRCLHQGQAAEPADVLAQPPQAAGVIAARLAAWAGRQQNEGPAGAHAVVPLPRASVDPVDSRQSLAA